MITGSEGGFVHRMMPPTDWDCGQIPTDCYDPSLTVSEIRERLLQVYCTDERVRKLADSDEVGEILAARSALELLAEIDADTICGINIIRDINKSV